VKELRTQDAVLVRVAGSGVGGRDRRQVALHDATWRVNPGDSSIDWAAGSI
jgi:hypothetical protein